MKQPGVVSKTRLPDLRRPLSGRSSEENARLAILSIERLDHKNQNRIIPKNPEHPNGNDSPEHG